MDDRIDLSELIRDPDEILDLLQAYGEEPPRDRKAARNRLLELTEHIGETRLISTLFEFAKGFARMLDEVLAFCDEKEVQILGQIQLKSEEALERKTALLTSWARGGKQRTSDDLEARVHAMITEVTGLVEQLDPSSFIRDESRRVELPSTSDPESRIIARILARTEHYDAFSEGDLIAIQAARSAVGEAQGSLAGTPVLGGVLVALAELDARLSLIAEVMQRAEMIRNQDASPEIISLSSEIYLLAMQWRFIAEEATEGRRVEEGFREFVRSEFWPARWRIYELWMLVRVLRALETAGGTLRLKAVEKGVWMLPYGRATEPVAICEFSSGDLQVFYQYWREDDEGADMPDLVVKPMEGRSVLVLDPKHGLTYSRSELEKVLRRYAGNLLADITAIVNYFAKTDYPFQDVRWDTRQWILASDVAPGTISLQRLELRFAEALLARGYRAVPDIAEVPIPIRARRQPARASYLLYWARQEREVDEPPGPWVLGERGAPRHLPKLDGVLPVGPYANIRGIEATVDGEACVIRTRAGKVEKMIWLCANRKPRVDSLELSDRAKFISWNLSSTLYALADGDTTLIFNRHGEPVATVANPHSGNVLGWSTNGEQLFLTARDQNNPQKLFLYRLDGLNSWELVHVLEAKSTYASYPTRKPYMWSDERTLLDLGGYGSVLVDSNGEVLNENVEGDALDCSVLALSPSGIYGLYNGPVSRRCEEGVRLLRIVDRREGATPMPLVRFFGRLQGIPSWSSDESRIAFFVQPEFGMDQLGSEERLMLARLGDRHAHPVSMPGQNPQAFAWISRSLLKSYL